MNKSFGEKNLARLLATLDPQLLADEYVFCCIPNSVYGDYAELKPIASYQEIEGLTLLITREQAERTRLTYSNTFRGISLAVHSSLDAVGLTAAIAQKLAERGISANVIAAFYHDHIFVPSDTVTEAMQALAELSQTNKQQLTL